MSQNYPDARVLQLSFSMGVPPKFGDLGKKSNDTLNDDYNFDVKTEIKAPAQNNVALTTAMKRTASGVVGSLTGKYKFGSGSSVKTKLETGGKCKTDVELGGLADGLTVKVAVEPGNLGAGQLGFEYGVDGLNAAVGIDGSMNANLDAVFGFGDFAVGAASSWKSQSSKLEGTRVGAQYASGDLTLTACLADDFNERKVSFSHAMNDTTTAAAEFKHRVGGDTVFLAGVHQNWGNDSSVRAKLDSAGMLSCCYSQKVQSGVRLVVSMQGNTLDAKDASRFGLSVLME